MNNRGSFTIEVTIVFFVIISTIMLMLGAFHYLNQYFYLELVAIQSISKVDSIADKECIIKYISSRDKNIRANISFKNTGTLEMIVIILEKDYYGPIKNRVVYEKILSKWSNIITKLDYAEQGH